jgi:threonine/homoserine/homoserine lactone efflux protein
LHWAGFLTAAVLLNLSPGPDIAFIMGQTVRGGHKAGFAALFLHGFLIIVVAAFIEPPLVIAGERLTNKQRNNPRFGMWLDRGLGAILVGLGIRLAMEDR